MKKCVKKFILVPLFTFFVSMQPVALYSGFINEVHPLKEYFLGAAMGACAVVGVRAIAQKIQRFSFKNVTNLSNMPLKGYVGAIPQEVADLILQLRDVEKYKKMGVSLTKGFIFFGEPGSGKTHLARSIAAEINCPFFAANATDFKQPHVGEAKNAIKKLFEKARDEARQHSSHTAIIFIDEFDAVGMRAGTRLEGGIDETINALLNELDGFNQHQDVHIVVIAATNILNNIDPALKRSGRFDHKIYIPYPDLQARILFIQTFLAKYPSAANICPIKLAQVTEGMSPADLVLLFEIAGRIAIRSHKNKRDADCFDEALKQLRVNRR